MHKNIVRYHTVGQPVVIGARPKEEKPVEKPSEELEEKKVEKEPEPEPEPKNAIPQEVLDKVFAEIEEIERKEKNKIAGRRIQDGGSRRGARD